MEYLIEFLFPKRLNLQVFYLYDKVIQEKGDMNKTRSEKSLMSQNLKGIESEWLIPYYFKDVTKQTTLKKKALSFFTKFSEILRIFAFPFSYPNTNTEISCHRLIVKNKSNEHINKITNQKPIGYQNIKRIWNIQNRKT